jgi:hypothetical protein
MNEFEIWLYRGLIAALVMIVGYVVKVFATRVTDRLDKLIDAMNTHEGRISQIVQTQEDHSKRLNDHGGRIRTLEIDHAKGCREVVK